ncbi:MAG: thiamine pyrophosphate-binding protein, partial [Desulfobacterales bacterium]
YIFGYTGGAIMPITKQTYMPLSVDKIEETIHEAFYVAWTGRGGPVVVDIPKDIQLQETDPSYQFNPDTYEPELPGFLYSPFPDRDRVREAVALINKSERPIVLSGHGVITSNAGKNLQKFAEIGPHKIIEVARSGFTAL